MTDGVLFVSNGHGESAIADRIARELRTFLPFPAALDHLSLVGVPRAGAALTVVGPNRAMPSGGLVAMGNLRALARDLHAGLAGLVLRQIAFLRGQGPRYRCAVAVGDVYALLLARLTRRPTVFVGTAKSVYVAAYGPFERMLLRGAARVFVRDDETAKRLRAQGVAAEAPGNTIVDLLDDSPAPPVELAGNDWIGILPGSRDTAYADAVRLARVVRALGALLPETRALLSIAPALDAERVAQALAEDGWRVASADSIASVPFRATAGSVRLIAWHGSLGTLLHASRLVLGQAGTANEQAAAIGLPVVALDFDEVPGGARRSAAERWYRMRQRGLLGDALALVPPAPERAAAAIAELLADDPRIERMRSAGRRRMGAPGGSRSIARGVFELLGQTAAESP
jgi:uncharacterized protein (TIGR03492 family)